MKKVASVTALVSTQKKSDQVSVNLNVLVRNVGSGHFMPTGLPGLRQMWMETVVRDSQGVEVFRNSSPIGIEPLDSLGNPTMPWNAVRFGKDTQASAIPIINPRKLVNLSSMNERYRNPMRQSSVERFGHRCASACDDSFFITAKCHARMAHRKFKTAVAECSLLD